MVWLNRSPIPVGRRGVISSFKWFLPAFPREGGGRHPVTPTHWPIAKLMCRLVLGTVTWGRSHSWTRTAPASPADTNRPSGTSYSSFVSIKESYNSQKRRYINQVSSKRNMRHCVLIWSPIPFKVFLLGCLALVNGMFNIWKCSQTQSVYCLSTK